MLQTTFQQKAEKGYSIEIDAYFLILIQLTLFIILHNLIYWYIHFKYFCPMKQKNGTKIN